MGAGAPSPLMKRPRNRSAQLSLGVGSDGSLRGCGGLCGPVWARPGLLVKACCLIAAFTRADMDSEPHPLGEGAESKGWASRRRRGSQTRDEAPAWFPAHGAQGLRHHAGWM